MSAIAILIVLAGAIPQMQDMMTGLPKRQALGRLLSTEAAVPIADAIALIEAGLKDPDASVRGAALGAIGGRSQMSLMAGTSPSDMLGPPPPGMPAPRRLPPIPDSWKDDRAVLAERFRGRVVTLAASDPSPRVRHGALLALLGLDIAGSDRRPLPDGTVALFLQIHGSDKDAMVRAEVLKTFRLLPNVSPAILETMRGALIDPDLRVQEEAQRAITPAAVGGRSKLAPAFVIEAVAPALESATPNVRLGAVRALNILGAASAAWLPALREMARTDADARVRASAQLAVEAIERARAGGRETP